MLCDQAPPFFKAASKREQTREDLTGLAKGRGWGGNVNIISQQ